MIRGLVFYGFPLHPAGKPGTDRSDHLQLLRIPMLFLQGTKDALATWSLIETVCQSLPAASLIGLEDVDHSFRSGRTDIIARLASETARRSEEHTSELPSLMRTSYAVFCRKK